MQLYDYIHVQKEVSYYHKDADYIHTYIHILYLNDGTEPACVADVLEPNWHVSLPLSLVGIERIDEHAHHGHAHPRHVGVVVSYACLKSSAGRHVRYGSTEFNRSRYSRKTWWGIKFGGLVVYTTTAKLKSTKTSYSHIYTCIWRSHTEPPNLNPPIFFFFELNRQI